MMKFLFLLLIMSYLNKKIGAQSKEINFNTAKYLNSSNKQSIIFNNKTYKLIKSSSTHNKERSTDFTPNDPEFYIYLGISLVLCLFAGLCSGLTVGYLSIDDLTLDIKMRNGTPEEKRAASEIFPILQRHHVLLSTLLIANALALETLPIFLAATVPDYLAIIISTLFVVLFSEILPQAICTGPKQIQIAQKMAGTIKVLMLIFSCIAIPLGAFLDWLLGTHHVTRFPRKDLKALIELHQVLDENHEGNNFSHEESELLTGIIDLRDEKVKDIMIPYNKIFKIYDDEKITSSLLLRLKAKMFSRVPVFDKQSNKIVGVVKTKDFINKSSSSMKKLSILETIEYKEPLIVNKDTSLLEMLMIFQDKKESIAFVDQSSKKSIGTAKSSEYEKDENYYSRMNLILDPTLKKTEIIGLLSVKDIFEAIVNKEFPDDDLHISLNPVYRKNKKNMTYSLFDHSNHTQRGKNLYKINFKEEEMLQEAQEMQEKF